MDPNIWIILVTLAVVGTGLVVASVWTRSGRVSVARGAAMSSILVGIAIIGISHATEAHWVFKAAGFVAMWCGGHLLRRAKHGAQDGATARIGRRDDP